MKNLRLVSAAFAGVVVLTACGGSRFAPAAPASGGAAAGSRSVKPATAQYKLLYSFAGTPDGASPLAGLLAAHGTLYGLTLNGGASGHCNLGCGTVFSVSRSGSESVVYSFKGNASGQTDGLWPFASLTALKGVMYGTTGGGGAGDGTVFTVSAGGTEHVLYPFAGGTDAQDPESALIAAKGKLYGTSVYGGGSGCGGNGCGTVFQISPAGTEKVLYRFAGGTDGARLYAGVTYLHGTLYGATFAGGGSGCGGSGCGTIYSLNPTTGKEQVLYRFTGSSDGAFPNGLTAVKGVLYGTTEGGGARSSGTFFSVTTSGTLQTLYSFKDIPDGNLPGANLLYLKGTLYGTTVGGGTKGVGTVFAITTSGSENVLYSFTGGSDGSDPQAPLVALKGSLYSTTYTGGGTGCSGGNGCGTVFRVTP